jgi:hypothetical protein
MENMRTVLPKLFFLTIAVCRFATVGFAQDKQISGKVIDSATQKAIQQASILNILSGNVLISKEDGSFTTTASEGQIYAFSANGYYSDTFYITNAILENGSIQVKLKSINATLQDVTVTASHYSIYQQDSIQRRRYFLQTIGEKKVPTISRANDLGFGIALNLDHYSKTEKNKRQARSMFEVIEEGAYINHRWNKDLIEKYTSFTGDELTNFMQQARPKYGWLRAHPAEEDMLYYINSQLKKLKLKKYKKEAE